MVIMALNPGKADRCGEQFERQPDAPAMADVQPACFRQRVQVAKRIGHSGREAELRQLRNAIDYEQQRDNQRGNAISETPARPCAIAFARQGRKLCQWIFTSPSAIRHRGNWRSPKRFQLH